MRMQLKLIISIALVTLTAVGCQQDKPVDDRVPAVSEIISRMAKTYSECKNYRDTGTVTKLFKLKNETETNITEFTTAMVRPDRFRFEYTEKGKPNTRYVIWREGTEVRKWWDVTQKFENPESLGMAVAGATGVSGGSAHTIPALLMPLEIGGRMLTDLEHAKRGEDEVFDDHQCFTIDAQYADDPITIWIDQETFLVRKIESVTEFKETSNRPAFTCHESTTYDPVINEDMPPTLLEYNAPK